MKINTNSWHFRLCLFYEFNIADNLCRYFWQVVTAMGLTFIMALMGLFLFLFLLYPVWAWWMPADMWPLAFVPAFVYLMIGVSILNEARGWATTTNSVLTKEVFDCDEHSFCRLIYEWIRAKKEKVCPRLEFTNGRS